MRFKLAATQCYALIEKSKSTNLHITLAFMSLICLESTAILSAMAQVPMVQAPPSFARQSSRMSAALNDPDEATRNAARAWISAHVVRNKEQPVVTAVDTAIVPTAQGDELSDVTLLQDTSPDVRTNAAYAFGKKGAMGATFAPQVAALLEDVDLNVRRAAIDTLVKMGVASAFAPQIAAMATDNDLGAREDVINALGSMGSAAAPYAPQVAAVLEDADPGIRHNAAQALGKMGAAAAFVAPQIADLLSHPDAGMRRSALDGLINLGEAATPYAAQVALMLQDSDPQIRKYAAGALGTMKASQYAPQLVALLQDPNSEVRATAAWWLSTFGVAAAEYAPEVAALLQTSYIDVRDNEIAVLGRMKATEYAPQVAAMLKDANPSVRREAVTALGNMGATTYAPQMVALLGDSDSFVRDTVRAALKAMGVADTVLAPQAVTLLNDVDPHVRQSAIIALYETGVAYAPNIATRLQDRDPTVRRIAVHSLLRIAEVAPFNDTSIFMSLLNATCIEKGKEIAAQIRLLTYLSRDITPGTATGERDLILIRWLGNRSISSLPSARDMNRQQTDAVIAAFKSISPDTKHFPALRKDIAKLTANIRRYSHN